MLGIIAGETSLPKYLINKLIKNNYKFLILDLTKSNIKTLPEGLEVGHSLWLLECWGLTSLPKGLKVGDNLNIYKTKLEEYSDDELIEMIKPGFIKGSINR